MKPKICIPVMGKSLKEFLQNLEKVQKMSDCIELRMDSIEEFQATDIETIHMAVRKEAIFTYRHPQSGGYTKIDEPTRIQYLQKALDLGFDYVDVEIETFDRKYFHGTTKTKLIISYHNFIETPSYMDLIKIVDNMRSYYPNILKVATMVTKETDIITLTRILVNKLPKDQMIVLGMGDEGRITRIITPLLGGYLTFASSETGSSASGQIDIKTLIEIYTNISSLF
jgi:3-dehydroquinate dehydratase type I